LKLLICNLKMNHTLKEMIEYRKRLEEENVSNMILCPATCFLPIMHSSHYELCAQNVSLKKKENFTGATSLKALKSLDVKNYLVGHIETEDTLENKINKTKWITDNLGHAFVILTVTKEEHDYQYTATKLLGQIRAILSKIRPEYQENVSFIYEPYWLIGKEETLEEKVISNIFYQLKEELKRDYNKEFLLLYGGGLNENTILPFLESEYIDGLLLGSFANKVENVINLWKKECFSTEVDKTIHN